MLRKVQVLIEVEYDDSGMGNQDPFSEENVETYPDQVINAVRTTKNEKLQLIAVGPV